MGFIVYFRDAAAGNAVHGFHCGIMAVAVDLAAWLPFCKMNGEIGFCDLVVVSHKHWSDRPVKRRRNVNTLFRIILVIHNVFLLPAGFPALMSARSLARYSPAHGSLLIQPIFWFLHPSGTRSFGLPPYVRISVKTLPQASL